MELFDSRLLFWMEPHVLIWRSLMICSVHARHTPQGFWEELAGACPLVQSQLSSLLPAPAIFPEGRGCRQGTGAPGVWSWLPSRAALSLCPAPPITEWSCDRCHSSLRRGEVTESFGFEGSCTHAGCAPHDYVPCVTWGLPIISIARDKQLPREMDILATLI